MGAGGVWPGTVGGLLQRQLESPALEGGGGTHLTRTGRRRMLLRGGTWSPLQGFPRNMRDSG